jgi:uncharacterized protein (TIGR02231 family)
MIILDSTITSVTVYCDRAQITRNATADVSLGENRLQFKGLPENIERGSIQVKSTGSAILKDITLQKEHFSKTPDDFQKSLYDRKAALVEKLSRITDSLTLAKNEKKFVENIAKKLTGNSDSDNPVELDPDKWIKMVDFYRTKHTQLDEEIRTILNEEGRIKDEFEKVMGELGDIDFKQDRVKNDIVVLIDSNTDGGVKLTLTYVVYGPKWVPFYDLRVDTDSKKMEISYNAMIKQNTGEDWVEAALNLSTAMPWIGGEEPRLTPWHVEVYQPMDSFKTPAPAAPCVDDFDINEKEMEYTVMAPEEASVHTNITSYLYEIGGKNSILSDNNEHSTTIMIRAFEAQFKHSTTPKLADYAFLQSRVKNDSNFHFLPGDTNVFLNNNFVAHSKMESKSPGEEFTASLGVDDGVKVKYSFLRKFQKNDGFFHKRYRYVYDYQIEITNNKNCYVTIDIRDQLPISGSDNIIITLLKPKYEKDTEQFSKDEFNFLKWSYKIESKEKIVIPFSYYVEYSKELELTGMD